MATKPNIEHKQARVIALQTYILSLALTFVFTVMVGVVAGWFIHVNMESQARQDVVSDIQLTSKAAK